jgi:hypothetical protein
VKTLDDAVLFALSGSLFVWLGYELARSLLVD